MVLRFFRESPFFHPIESPLRDAEPPVGCDSTRLVHDDKSEAARRDAVAFFLSFGGAKSRRETGGNKRAGAAELVVPLYPLAGSPRPGGEVGLHVRPRRVFRRARHRGWRKTEAAERIEWKLVSWK